MDTADTHKQLIAAASAGDAQKMQELLPVAPARSKNKALVQAAKNGHAECVKILLTQCKNERENQRALLNAFRNGCTQCVELLLPYYPGSVEEDHWLLMDAVNKGQVDMVRVLLPVSQQKTIDDALMAAAINGDYECAKELVAKATLPTKSEALSRAALGGHLSCVKLLIPVSNPKSKESQALGYAVSMRHTQCIEVLFEVSESKKVLARLQNIYPRDPDVWMVLAEMVESKAQRAMLTAVTEKHDAKNTIHRSKKM